MPACGPAFLGDTIRFHQGYEMLAIRQKSKWTLKLDRQIGSSGKHGIRDSAFQKARLRRSGMTSGAQQPSCRPSQGGAGSGSVDLSRKYICPFLELLVNHMQRQTKLDLTKAAG